MSIIEDIALAVERGKKKEVGPLVEQALEEGIDPQVILNDGLVNAMSIIGDKFSRNEVFVPEMLIAARAMSVGTEILKPYLAEAGAESLGHAVIGTVAGDMHDIGKNLVRMMVEGKGIEIEDLGVDVSTEKFVEYVKEHPECDLLMLSALLTTTMPRLPEVIQALADAGLRDQVKVMIGGAPITQEFADEIGADAYTPDAGSAAAKAAELLA